MFTIYARNTGLPIMTTTNEALAVQSVQHGHRVTQSVFGTEQEFTRGG